mmetsp:Transcript_25095/g.34969  ORF Transcript_25095/g.34969 Transcript_25095/m.34969 type:complete len:630 (-) Transcript_25095:83-1972(-)|eukprot:CAMPEP_0184487276 /NCGR_PEP_ID=MMETSP0113_2-20130426/9666_1 /TAXON_ID=91329 /ORGANISM="Norrisiella sphaerica, Strain BC52" /LENGTH=629 /DNA_ID=CAMNT_0026869519 /DNA_START=308 /DNA_END=2197 /DNA_ORIENTATION=-
MGYTFGVVEGVLLAGLVLALILAYKLFFRGANRAAVLPEDEEKPITETEDKEDTGVPMTILYATQTGTAEDFAKQLEKEAQKRGYSPNISDVEEYGFQDKLEDESFVVLLLATFGEGEPTDSAQDFDGWLKDQDQKDMFDKMTFAVFALGNKQYEKFCEMGKKTDRKLARLGGERLLEVGLGDDDASIEDDFNEWKQKFFQAADKKFQIESAECSIAFEPSWEVEIIEDSLEYVSGFKPSADSKDNIEMCRVVVNRELRQKNVDGGSTLHIEFDINDTSINYYTADNLGVCPRNEHKICAKLCKRLDVHPKAIFKATYSGHHTGLPSECSMMDAMLWHLDINNPPKKSLLTTLAQYATDAKEAEELIALASPAEKEKYDAEMIRRHTSIPDLLERYASIKVPFSVFVEICPKMQPRFYTISSSSNAQPGRITITLSVLKGGICTNYLASLKTDKDKAPVFVRPSTFRLPKQLASPVIMVGPGTGLAPFMGFIQEFEYQSKNVSDYEKTKGARVLYFGCRRSTEDFIYKDELEAARNGGILTDLKVAFSREGKQKVYVQNLMQKDTSELYRHLQDGGYVFVCGGTSMGREVKDAFVRLVCKEGGKSEDAARAFVDDLHSQNRYVQELWSV